MKTSTNLQWRVIRAARLAVFLKVFTGVLPVASPVLLAQDYVFTLETPSSVCLETGQNASFQTEIRLAVPPGTVAGGWTIGLATSGPCSIVRATVEGTVAASVADNPPGLRDNTLFGFEKTEITQGNGNEGAVSVIILGPLGPVTLQPAADPHVVLHVDVAADTEGECVVSFRDGLRGSGPGVLNTVDNGGGVLGSLDFTDDARVMVVAPRIDVTPLSLDFGNVAMGDSENLTVVVTNPSSTCALEVNRIELDAASTSTDFGYAGPRALSIAPNDSFSANVTYSPSESGADMGTLRIRTNAVNFPIVDVPLAGTGGAGAPVFVRGDADADGNVTLTDALVTLGCLFLGSECPRCLDAADFTDDGEITINDAISTLGCLFLAAACPPTPFPGCGTDRTADGLSCLSFPPCVP